MGKTRENMHTHGLGLCHIDGRTHEMHTQTWAHTHHGLLKPPSGDFWWFLLLPQRKAPELEGSPWSCLTVGSAYLLHVPFPCL